MSSRRFALITGATAGIGAEFARQLAGRGFNLVLVARDAERLARAAAELTAQFGVAVETIPADLVIPEQVAVVESRVASAHHPVDYLVNNAGSGLRGDFDENAVQQEVDMLTLLATVPLRLTHAALGQMLPRRTGTILTVSSAAGFAGLGSYSAAKSWSIVFARWANAYYRSSGVTVTTLTPGFVRTEFHHRMGVTRESMAPGFMWLDARALVRIALCDADRRRAISVPSVRYRLIVGATRVLGVPIGWAVGVRGTGRRRELARRAAAGAPSTSSADRV